MGLPPCKKSPAPTLDTSSSLCRSMYDQRFCTSKLLTDNDLVCTLQLDWPFVGGTMRDGTVSVPRTTYGVPT